MASSLSATIQSSLATLSARERRMVMGAGLGLFVFIVFMVMFSFNSTAKKLRSNILTETQQLDEVMGLAGSYREAKMLQENEERKLAASNVRLMSLMEDTLKAKGLDVPAMNPRGDVPLSNPKIVENTVEFTLTEVKLNRLLDFLQAVENSPGVVKVKYLRLEPKPASESITAWMTIATYKLKN